MLTATFTPTTQFNRHMARGHYLRTGHALTGHYVEMTDFPGCLKLIRTCCKENQK